MKNQKYELEEDYNERIANNKDKTKALFDGIWGVQIADACESATGRLVDSKNVNAGIENLLNEQMKKTAASIIERCDDEIMNQ